jgi:hypothetical protein
VVWALQQAAHTLARGARSDDFSRSLAIRVATHLIGRGFHSFTVDLNLSNSRTHSRVKLA